MAVKFEDLQKANDTIRTINIKGKEYAEVNQRIKAFRMVYPHGTIETNMLSNDNGVCVFRASAYDAGELLGTGHAYEVEGSTFINRTSYLENAESSAIGRCLGTLGFGIDTSVASYEEVANAQANQEANKPITKGQVKCVVKLAEAKGSDLSEICAYFGVGKLEEMTAKEYGECLDLLNRKKNVDE